MPMTLPTIDREGPDRLRRVLRHQGDHRARVDTAAEKRPERHVTDETVLDGTVERLLHGIDSIVLRQAQLRLVAEGPVAFDAVLVVLDDETVAGWQLVHASERTLRRRHILEAEIVGDGLRVDRGLERGFAEEGAHLGHEGQPISIHAVEQRLLADAISGDQHAPP